MIVGGVLFILSAFVGPKYTDILKDFHVKMPAISYWLFHSWYFPDIDWSYFGPVSIVWFPPDADLSSILSDGGFIDPVLHLHRRMGPSPARRDSHLPHQLAVSEYPGLHSLVRATGAWNAL